MRILCVGQINADISFFPVEHVDFNNVAVTTQMLESVAFHGGGCAMNTAVNLARLGAEVAFVGAVGDDAYGGMLRGELIEAGVDESGLFVSPELPTGTVAVLVNRNAERKFLYYLGANAVLSPGHVYQKQMEGFGIVHVGGALLLPALDGEGTAEMFKQAQKHGIITTMDVSSDPEDGWLRRLRPSFPHLDYFLPSLTEAERITGQRDVEAMADALLEMGVGNVVIKLGDRGCYGKNRHTSFYMPAYRVRAVNTNGAGDAFVAGFLLGLSEGLSFDRCAETGCAAGAIVTTDIAATSRKLTRTHLQSFMQSERKNEG